MHIAIDISPTQSGHKARGVGQYTKLLQAALQKTHSKHTFHFFSTSDTIPKNVDLVHYTYFDPFFLTLPLFQTVPYVVTVHDVIPLAYPEMFPRGVRGEVKWFFQKSALQRSRRILTDSNASKLDIHRIVKYNPAKIDVIYLAPSPVFKPINDVRIHSDVSRRYSLPEKFILYVGDVNANKNLLGLLQAFSEVNKEFKKISLVLIGKAFLNDRLSETIEINRRISELKLENNIQKLGFVSDADLVALYSIADVYVQPSFAEGFGFPILEAMACGCPVVTSKASSLSEIAGPSIMVDPYDPTDIARGIISILKLDKAGSVSQKGITWSKKFTWEKVASNTIASYEKAMGGD